MSVEVVEREVAGIQFRIRPLPFKPARKVFVKVASIAGPALAHLAANTASLGDLGLARAVSTALSAVSDEDLEWIAEQYQECQYSLNGKDWPYLDSDRRDALFSDPAKFPVFFMWLAVCLEVQFGGFSNVLGIGKPVGAPVHGTPTSSKG